VNLLDTIIIIIVGTTFVMSLFRGVLKEVFSLGSVILGFVMANQAYPYVAEFLSRYIHHASMSKILGYTGVFLGSTIAIRLLGSFFEKATRKAMLGWADHLIGSLFGFLKGCLIVSVIIMLMTSFMPKSPVLRESKLTPYILSTVGVVADLSPREIRRKFDSTRKELRRKWKQNLMGDGSGG